MRPAIRWSRAASLAVAVALGSFAGFCALEGGASLLLFAIKAVTLSMPAFEENRYTAYDPELGWVSRRNVRVPDLYGPSIGLTTNAQGFRASRDLPREAPPDRLRVVCSGDSFTLGYGVADDRPWCARLALLDARLETVNMGQGGYGIDQAYLWYQRDGEPMEHGVLVFALITGDFERMRWPVFVGHGKPILAVEDGHLVTRNVPVPEPWFRPRGMWRRLSLAARELRATQLLARLKSSARGGPAAAGGVRFDEATWAVASKVFESLQAASRAQHRVFVVLYLPTGDDYESPESDPWRARLRQQAREQQFTLVDLVPEFRELSARAMRSLLLGPGTAGHGHYNDAGHQWVADRLIARLEANAAVQARLARLPSREEPASATAAAGAGGGFALHDAAAVVGAHVVR